MKKYSLYIACSLLLGMGACQKDVMEKEPLEYADLELVFDPLDSLGVNAEKFLYNIYNDLPRGYNRIDNNVLDAGTDDAVPSNINASVQYFSTGQWSPYLMPEDRWKVSYEVIRKVNIFLENIGRVPLKTDGLKEQWIAEARFMRAMAYFELSKRWSGVPIVGDKVFELNDDVALARDSYDEVVSYISNEIDAIVGDLPSEYTAAYFGRVTKGGALALKARNLLYAASPWHNESNDLQKWQAAADAAKDVMDLDFYSLTGNFTDAFLKRKNTEVILAYMASPNSTVERLNGPMGSQRGDQGLTNPTQDLVDAFGMANGLGIHEAGSGYDENDPYAGRDPRFYATIFHNNMSWLGRKVETFDGGLDRPLGYGRATSGETRTGYYMRKFLGTGGSNNSYSNAEHCFPIFRYAEVLLNYAEALNEVGGPTQDVYDAVEDVRRRAKLVPYALPAGLSKAEMRDRIRGERRVEMAFEEQRFWDIRRWKIAGDVLNKTLTGIQVIKQDDDSFQYNRVDVLKTSFDVNRMYLYPIPYSELLANPNMAQNPNW